MKNKTQLTYGLVILIPLLLSTLFLGLNSITNADQNDGLALNQAEVGMLSSPEIWLKLEIDGNWIWGDSELTSLERENTIRVFSLRHDIESARDAASYMASTNKIHSPIVFTKRIDQSSPLLFKALSNNEVVSEAEFRYFRPNKADGSTQHYYSIKIMNGYISGIRTFSMTDYTTGATLNMEEVSVVYQSIEWTYVPDGIQFADTLGEA
ncbi:MAG: type VI secretion system tube protein TssD [Candidatus Kariarchaeaceae archaeon]|jgi:type VI secretion system secreted protein Hcp